MFYRFYTLGHFAAFIPPGSVKLSTTMQGGSNWNALAAQTGNGGRVVELLNNGAASIEVAVVDEQSGSCFVATVAAKSLSTFVWSDGNLESGIIGESGASSGGSSGLTENSGVTVAHGSAFAYVAVSTMLMLALVCL